MAPESFRRKDTVLSSFLTTGVSFNEPGIADRPVLLAAVCTGSPSPSSLDSLAACSLLRRARSAFPSIQKVPENRQTVAKSLSSAIPGKDGNGNLESMSDNTRFIRGRDQELPAKDNSRI